MSLPTHALLPLMMLFTGASIAQPVGHSIELHDKWQTGDDYMQVSLRGALLLNGDPALAEISGLAWDQDEQLLHAVTDRGWLLQLRPEFRDGRLIGADLVARLRLLDRRGRKLRKPLRDAEGVAIENGANGIHGDTRLLISFEGRPRIERYRPDGRPTGPVELPLPLQDPGRYRHPNNGLEALTLHPRFGLISGPEFSADDAPIGLFGTRGGAWRYAPEEIDGALVGLDTLPDGRLLLLERAFTRPYSPWVITLFRVDLSQRDLAPEILARFDGTEGWRTQNIEGVAWRPGGGIFLASDDGGKALLQTQLIYLELRR